MASAIIPLISVAAPLLKPVLRSLIIHIEHLFGAKTGPAKLDVVVNAALTVVNQLATAGKLPGNLDAAHIVPLVESVVGELKKAGILNPDTAGAIVAQPVGVSTEPAATLHIVGGTLQFQVG